MHELHAAADKLFTEVDHLDRILDGQDAPSDTQVMLALGVAKAVRKHSTLLVRLLAAARDNKLQS